MADEQVEVKKVSDDTLVVVKITTRERLNLLKKELKLKSINELIIKLLDGDTAKEVKEI